MRLPWIQVTEEDIGRAEMLAGLLPKLKRREAIGLLVDLWKWAGGLGPKNEPPSGELRNRLAVTMLAGAVEWRGDAAELARALVSVGVLEFLADGVRVLGLERYHALWRKNRGLPPMAYSGSNTGSVYFVRRGETGPIKIGYSQRPLARVAKLQTASPEPLRLLRVLPGSPNLEADLHRRFAAYRLEGEWFLPVPEVLAAAGEAA